MLRKVEKYEVLEEIGHGGMATVYRARDTVLDRPVALKIMHPHLRAAEEARARFHREAQSVARLRHPRVLEVYDFSGLGSPETYIAAELLTGPTLKVFRESRGDVPAEIAACFTIEIARALEAAHEAGIIHRDVKPENVLLHEARTLKLTDFGIADMVDAQSMTATGQILGSPGHMAPEQIEGRDCDARTDLFSLGTVLYYLTTGRLPFTGRNPHQVLKRIMDGEYADPLRVCPTVGGPMKAIIAKSLELDPNARYQSARELIEALEAFIADAGIESAEALLARYLQDPDEVTDEIRSQVVEHLITRGAAASDAGDVPAALDCFNRVLALDEGNERVLRLLERVGQDRRRRRLAFAGTGLAVFGLGLGLAAFALWPEGDPRTEEVVTPVNALSTDGGLVDAAPTDTGADDASADEPDGGEDAATPAEVASPAADAGSGRAPTTPSNGVRPDRGSRTPRSVLFVFTPRSVQLAIDDGPARTVGTDYYSEEMVPGRYRFRLTPTGDAADRFRAETFERAIPPGEDPHRLVLRLPYANAGVLFRSNVPGNVIVADGLARGRTHSVVFVPMRENDQATLPYVVEAEGHSAATGRVALEAGQTREIEVTLRPDAEP